MAIRFEPKCDDNGQWHVGATANLYPNRGQSSRSLSTNSPLDLRYSETSDYEERGTSSCSPDSCDLSAQEKLHFHPGTVPCGRPFSRSPDKDMYHRDALVPEWKNHAAYMSDIISNGEMFQRLKRAKTISNLEECNENKSGDFQKPSMIFHGKTTDSVFSRLHDVSSDKALFLTTSSESKQNGGTLRKSAFVSRRSHSKYAFSHYHAASSNNEVEVVKTTAVKDLRQKTAKSHLIVGVNQKLECFGETDAAEALLGLSEGFYQSVQSTTTATSVCGDHKSLHNKLVERPGKDLASNNGANILNSNSSAISSTNFPKPCSASITASSENNASTKHSKFHFKKLICQKFVNSVQPEPDKSRTNVSENNALSEQAKIKTTVTLSNNATTQDKMVDSSVKDPVVKANTKQTTVNEAKNSSEKLKVDPDNSLTQLPQTKTQNSKQKVIDKDKELVNDIANTLKKTSGFSKHNEKSVAGPTPESKRTSNLYRISTSLGSSNESLSGSNEDANDDEMGCESSSDSSNSESDNDETDSPVLNSELPAWKKNNWSTAASQCKSFVMHKPKFSVPLWEKPTKPSQIEEKIGLKKIENNKNSTFSDAVSELSRNSAVQKQQFVFGSASESSVEPNKQSGTHIKKATFTFNRAAKDAKITHQSGLSVTSQESALVERTQCAEKDKNCFRFDRDKLDCSEAVKAKQARSQNESSTKDRGTFGMFRKGDSFENLSKPSRIKTDFAEIKTQADTKHYAENLPYDKGRLPRPSARSAELEARQLVKSKAVRKRKLSTFRDKSKENPRLLEKPLKRSKHSVESTKKAKSRHISNKKQVATTKTVQEKSIEQNGAKVVETNVASAQSSLEKSSSRRKPSRVYKHQKYTSVSMMSTSQNARVSSEFSLISKPLNLDHRVLLANSIDLDRASSDNLGIDSNVSSPMTSSTCSSSTSSVAGDDNDVDMNKIDGTLTEKNRLRRHRHLSAVETNPKSDIFRRKQKMKRLFSVSETRKAPVRLMTSNVLANNWQRSIPKKGELTSFRLLSLFPAPASIRAGYAHGELLPGYGPSVSGQRSSLPLRWTKGSDVSDLKQKRQRERWRSMTLDMFCMGAKS